MDVLFPPVLENQGLSFPFYSQNAYSHFLDVRFPMPLGTNVEDIGHVQVSIKYLNTGEPAVNQEASPDKQVLYISAKSAYFEEADGENFVVHIPYDCFAAGFPAMDTTYLLQVRFGSTALWQGTASGIDGRGYENFAAWRTACTTSIPSTFGEWSNLMKIYCYGAPRNNDVSFDFVDFMPRVKWLYKPSGDDPVEQVMVTYWYSTMEGVEQGTNIFNGQYQNDNTFSFVCQLPIAPVKEIQVAVDAVTKNNTKWHNEINIPSLVNNLAYISANYGEIEDAEFSAPEIEDGAIGKILTTPKTMNFKKFNVYRIETLTTKCLRILSKQDCVAGEEILFKDFTCEMGEDYQYVCISVNDKGECKEFLTPLTPYGTSNPGYARLMRMDSSYLVSRAHQLRIQGNVQLSSFKRNVQDNFQTTIGSKYPFYSRASKINYRSFTLNGLISINFDPTSSFLRLDAIGKIKYLQEITYNQYTLLVQKSPGVKEFFTKRGADEQGMPKYVFTGPKDTSKMTAEQCEALVNRCAANLVLNGLWWDSDDGTSSELYIQDRDIISNTEVSLSARRSYADDLRRGPKIQRLGTEDPHDFSDDNQRTFYDQYYYRQTGLGYGTTASDELVYIERKFREKVMEWLSDGKPKLFRSETEGNMIVQLSNVSFTPFDKSGRMVYTMSATVTEIDELNSENLEKYNLVPSLIRSVYIDNSIYEYTWGNYDPNVSFYLQYIYYESFRIPNMIIGDASADLNINTKIGVVHGEEPYRFTATNLPQGITIDERTGVISGYPIGTSLVSPGLAILQVTDGNGQKADMELPYGWMYFAMRALGFPLISSSEILPDGTSKQFVEVGESIKNIDLNDYFTGGVPPYSFSPTEKQLPAGLTLNASTGIISGSYNAAPDAGESEVVVRDSIGNSITLVVRYIPGAYPLSFIKINGSDYGYTEVGVAIPEVDFSVGVGGGMPPYMFRTEDLPPGWVIHPDTGVVSGVPTIAMMGGTFTIVVVDSSGAERSIKVSYNDILATFVFEGTAQNPVETIWIMPNNPGDKVIHDITLGTVLTGLDVTPLVSGGLPFTSGAPYRFQATGLLPNWRIDENWGVLSGRAQSSVPAHQATLIAIDARGQKRTLIIEVGEVKGGLEFTPLGYNVGELYVGIPVADNDFVTMKGSVKSKRITIDKIANGNGNYSIILSNAPAGVSLVHHEATSSSNEYWEFEGTPIQASAARIAWLTIKDSNGLSTQAQVNFGKVYGELAWNDPSAASITGIPGNTVEYSLGLSGGKPPFTITYTGGAMSDMELATKPKVEIIQTDPNDTSTWRVRFTMPEGSQLTNNVIVTVKDELKTITKSFIVKTSTTKMTFTKLKDFRDEHCMQNHAVFDDIQVIKISGGVRPYRITQGEVINGDLKFVIVQDTVVVRGTPTNLAPTSNDLGQVLEIADSSTGEGQNKPTKLGFTFMAPIVDPMPAIGPEIPGGTLVVEDLPYQTYYTTPYLFTQMKFPGIAIEDSGVLPTGIASKIRGEYFYLDGKTIQKTETNYVSTYVLTTPKTTYDEVITLEVTVIFGAIQGLMEFYIDQNTYVPALAKGKPMDPFLISEGLVGGSTDISWALVNAPAGLTIQTDPADKRIAYIQGTPSEEKGIIYITVEVTDNKTQVTRSDRIVCKGVYEPINILKEEVEIPEGDAGTEIESVSIAECVDGGKQPFKYGEVGTDLKDRGFTIDSNGIITGTRSAASFAEVTAEVLVVDQNGQEVKIKVKIGEINGPLAFDANATGVRVSIPTGKVKTAVATADLPVLTNGAIGGKKPYTWEESATDGPKVYGFTGVTFNFATGVFTALTRPETARPKGTFTMNLKDAENGVLEVPISFDEITE